MENLRHHRHRHRRLLAKVLTAWLCCWLLFAFAACESQRKRVAGAKPVASYVAIWQATANCSWPTGSSTSGGQETLLGALWQDKAPAPRTMHISQGEQGGGAGPPPDPLVCAQSQSGLHWTRVGSPVGCQVARGCMIHLASRYGCGMKSVFGPAR